MLQTVEVRGRRSGPTCNAVREYGQVCRGIATSSGLCTNHDPGIKAARQRGLSQRLPTAPITDYLSLTDALCRQLEVSRYELARRLELHEQRISLQHYYGYIPFNGTLARLTVFVAEQAPELIPAHIYDPQKWLADLTQEKYERRQKKEVFKRARKKLRDKVSRWTRRRMISEVADLCGGETPDKLEKMIRMLPYYGSVGAAGYKVYLTALGVKGQQHISEAGRQRSREGARFPRTERGRARGSLGSIRGWLQRGNSFCFPCQGCGELDHRSRTDVKVHGLATLVLCGRCRRDYYRTSGYMDWMRGGAKGPQPPLPKRSGHPLTLQETQERVILCLRYRLGKLDHTPSPSEYEAIYDIERRLRDSSDPWCQRITSCLDILS